MVDKENLFRLSLDRARNSLSVTTTKHQDFKNEEIKCALQKGDRVGV